MKLDLGDVTVCAVASTNVQLAARALNISIAQCKFSDAILLSHAPVEGGFRFVQIDEVNSVIEYEQFVCKKLPNFIDSPFLLIVQWDGYVVDAQAWKTRVPRIRLYRSHVALGE